MPPTVPLTVPQFKYKLPEHSEKHQLAASIRQTDRTTADGTSNILVRYAQTEKRCGITFITISFLSQGLQLITLFHFVSYQHDLATLGISSLYQTTAMGIVTNSNLTLF
jgi:hypothetical protein